MGNHTPLENFNKEFMKYATQQKKALECSDHSVKINVPT